MRRGLLLFLALIPLLARAAEPDLRVLWQLLHSRQLTLLQQAIRDYRQRYPGWHPPAALQREIARLRQNQRDARFRRRLQRILRHHDWPALIQLANRHPERFRCRNPGLLQQLARAYAETGDIAGAARRYRRLLRCGSGTPDQMLSPVLWSLPPADFLTLLERLQADLPPDSAARLAYQARRRQLLRAYRQKRFDELERLAHTLSQEILKHRDLDLIRLLAWQAYDAQHWTEAAAWFQQGLRLAPEDENLAYGLLLSAIAVDDEHTLLRITIHFAARSERIRHAAAGYLTGKAWRSLHRGELARARHLAQRALPWAPSPDAVDYLLAWIDLEAGRFHRARDRFRRLYQRHPDDERYAEGLALTYVRSGEALPEPRGSSPFSRIVRRYRAHRAYADKRFLTAYRLNPNGFPALTNIDSGFGGGAVFYRFKSGTRGLGRLETRLLPTLEVSDAHGTGRFHLRAGRLELTSGQIKTRNLDQLTGIPAYRESLQQNRPLHALEAAVITAAYRHEGGLNPYFEVGVTPVNGLIGPRPTFRLQISQRWRATDWRLEAYSLPVRQTLLSYTGWKVLGKRWGRVLHSGLRGQVLTHLTGRWYLYQQLEAGFLDGRRTKDNWQIHYAIAPGYNLPLPGFDYFSLGPYFDFQHYGNNQNHFRFGHGGYFSPQRYYAVGGQVSFRTAEGKPLVLEGRLALGLQDFREDHAPWFPIGCPHSICEDGRYRHNSESGFAPDLRIRAVGRIHPHVQLGAGFYARMTGDYREIGGGLFLRVFLEPRRAVFSTDLPSSLFGAIE